MNESVRVDHLSKMFKLGETHETQLRDQIVNMLRGSFSRKKPERDILWALKDVSFSVEEGEIVGIVGGNGAGKSTLLKILSRITFPTTGNIRTNGRVAALLEVGTGFHEELSGRENIYLNGSILGMKKREVDSQLDAIVDFSGVERFLDTPIKRYSTGMRLRLGFAVAAHLNPDVLIVDEVLAVGDAGFQKKCLTAMKELRSGGRTVLFVSHHMSAVENLCTRGLWIDHGTLKLDGTVREVIDAYMSTFADVDSVGMEIENTETRGGSGEARYTKIEILDENKETKNFVRSGDRIIVRMHYQAEKSISRPSFGFKLVTESGALVTETSTWHHGIDIESVEAGSGYLDLSIDALNLMPGRYYFSLGLTGAGDRYYDWLEYGVRLDVETGRIYGSGQALNQNHGSVFFPQRWNFDGFHGLIAEDQ